MCCHGVRRAARWRLALWRNQWESLDLLRGRIPSSLRCEVFGARDGAFRLLLDEASAGDHAARSLGPNRLTVDAGLWFWSDNLIRSCRPRSDSGTRAAQAFNLLSHSRLVLLRVGISMRPCQALRARQMQFRPSWISPPHTGPASCAGPRRVPPRARGSGCPAERLLPAIPAGAQATVHAVPWLVVR